MALLSAFLLAAASQVDRSQTLGYTYAEILRMGQQRWTDVYAQKEGDSTLAISSGFSIYGAALAWRNDRLLKGRRSQLRDRLQGFSDHAQAVGSAATGGGSMWTIFAGQSYREVEQTLYQTLTHSYRGPKRVVSDVERAVDRLARVGAQAETEKHRREAREEILRLRQEMRGLINAARRLPRRDSDAVLEFAREMAADVAEQAKPI
jgi:hypothetical protein